MNFSKVKRSAFERWRTLLPSAYTVYVLYTFLVTDESFSFSSFPLFFSFFFFWRALSPSHPSLLSTSFGYYFSVSSLCFFSLLLRHPSRRLLYSSRLLLFFFLRYSEKLSQNLHENQCRCRSIKYLSFLLISFLLVDSCVTFFFFRAILSIIGCGGGSGQGR